MIHRIRVANMNNGGFVDLSQFGAELMLAKKLFKLGARTPIVCALCGIKRKTATRMYWLAQQQAPIKGMLPWDPQWIERATINNLHASIFLGLIQDYVSEHGNGIAYGQQFCAAYELYGRIVAHNPKPSHRESEFEHHRVLDINRAWQLTQQLRASTLRFVMCSSCHARHLSLHLGIQGPIHCPVCQTQAGIISRQSRVSRTFSQHAWKNSAICLGRY